MKKKIILHSVIGIVSIIILHLIFFSIRSYIAEKSISHHVDEILNSPEEMKQLSEQLNNDIQHKNSLLEEIKKRSEAPFDKKNIKYNNLKEQLVQELTKEKKTSFLQAFGVHFIFFILGGIVFLLSARLFKSKKNSNT